MKRWLSVCICVSLFLVLIIGIPVLINESYKCVNGYITFWGAKDVLEYYGSVLGAIGTVAAIIISVTMARRTAQAEIEKEKLKNEFENLRGKVLRIKEAILFEKEESSTPTLLEILISTKNKKGYNKFVKAVTEDFMAVSDMIDESDPIQKKYFDETKRIVLKQAEVLAEYDPKIEAAQEIYKNYETRKNEWSRKRRNITIYQARAVEFPEKAPPTAQEIENEMFNKVNSIAATEKTSYRKTVDNFIAVIENIYRKKVKQLFVFIK